MPALPIYAYVCVGCMRYGVLSKLIIERERERERDCLCCLLICVICTPPSVVKFRRRSQVCDSGRFGI